MPEIHDIFIKRIKFFLE